MFREKEGFTLQHDGTDKILTLTWREVISFASDLLIFGPPLDGTRRYNLCFRDRADAYSKRIYKNLAKETLGDVQSSSALTMAYQEKVIQLRDNKIHRLSTKNDVICL